MNDDGVEQVLVWDDEGNYFTGTDGQSPDPKDLFNVKTKREGWINIYPSGQPLGFHKTREAADANATDARIACIRIEWEE